MPEIWLTDIEQTKKILVLEESIKELQAELKQVRTEYERTREIVDAVRDCAWEIGFDSNRYIQTVIRSKDEVENTPLRSSLLMLAVQAEGISV